MAAPGLGVAVRIHACQRTIKFVLTAQIKGRVRRGYAESNLLFQLIITRIAGGRGSGGCGYGYW
jgi:hypothetical protein